MSTLDLQFLYPNKPKSQAFDRYRTIEGKPQQATHRPSYVPAAMKLVVFEENRRQPLTSAHPTTFNQSTSVESSSNPQSPTTFMNL
jgi:hypothetical protein